MNKNNNKLSLSIKKEELMDIFIFENENERIRGSKYLDIKGVAYHVRFVNLIGLNDNNRIRYKLVSDIYKYDKRIRNKLYKFTSAFEEQMRAFISNNYDETKVSNTIRNNIKEGSNIAIELESTNFSDVISIIKKYPKGKQKEIFPNLDKNLSKNLNAIRELRNIVSHHKILLSYNKYSKCYIKGREYNDLKSNIINLINLIDEFYKFFLIKEINEASIDYNDELFYVPEEFIIKI